MGICFSDCLENHHSGGHQSQCNTSQPKQYSSYDGSYYPSNYNCRDYDCSGSRDCSTSQNPYPDYQHPAAGTHYQNSQTYQTYQTYPNYSKKFVKNGIKI